MSSKRSFRRSFLCGAAIGALSLYGSAYAQDTDTTDGADEEVIEVIDEATEGEARQEKITVTGSLLRRSEFTSASPIQVITAEESALEGLIDSAEILQGSSIASGSTQINNQFQGFVVDGGTGVNTVDLRGCGTTRTLVLINGKRPGPGGTRGAVGAFDFNNLPGSIVQRYEILKDSGSTIYGSDAVCGVINVITRTSVDKPEITFNITKPFDSGGENYNVNGAYGFNFDSGSIALAASYSLQEDLSIGDRDYLDCEQDLVHNSATGELFDRVNRSVTANGPNGRRNCSNIYFNTVIDRVTGDRFVPSPDGREIGGAFGGLIPGYRPRENGLIPNGNGRAFYEDVLESPLYLTQDAINRNELTSFYAVGDFDLGLFGGTNSVTEVLLTNRQTKAEGWRQFFPDIRGTGVFGGFFAYPNDPGYANPINSVILPVYIWPSNTEVDADYLLLQQSFSGNIGSNWGWALGGSYSKSDASYTRNQIRATISGDWSVGNGDAPTYDVVNPDLLNGGTPAWQALVNQLTGIDIGNTEYTQYLINGSVTGNIFELPAGAVAAAVGFEYRDYEINDVPGEFTRSGDVWGSSTAGITAGSDNVAEIFAEVEFPLLKGQPFAESLTLNLSGRAFEYDSAGSGDVYKATLDWQINPSLRVRTTKGTSFRAPALFEQFLDAQTSFIGQFIDPCIDDGTRPNNARLNANCLAHGIPEGYQNLGASARVIAGGNGDTLVPETSDSFTAGFVFTPDFADFNLAVDYFEIEVNDQIAQLGAGNILAACYFSDPATFANNAFCNLFTRRPGTDPSAPFSIIDIQDQFLNINSQIQAGIDLELRYEREFNFGVMNFDMDATWTVESNTSLFAPGTVDGITNNDFNGTIGDPSLVARTRTSLDRGDWTYTWFARYVGNTSNARFADAPDGLGEAYFGTAVDVNYDAEAVIYHGLSARWQGDTWAFTGGIDNLFDEHPSTVSAEAATVRGNTPLVATQYDLLGRKAFIQISKTF